MQDSAAVERGTRRGSRYPCWRQFKMKGRVHVDPPLLVLLTVDAQQVIETLAITEVPTYIAPPVAAVICTEPFIGVLPCVNWIRIR